MTLVIALWRVALKGHTLCRHASGFYSLDASGFARMGRYRVPHLDS